MKTMNNWYAQFLSWPVWQRWSLFVFVAIGLFLRLLPPSHQIIWSYDQARDSFFMRQMVESRDLVLLGPQTEYYGLFHGPLYYYLFAPFYAISKGDPFLPLSFMILLTFSSVIPLSILVSKITKTRLAGLLVIFLFSVSYPFIEYSRWLFNVSLAIPFLSWAYLMLFELFSQREKANKYGFILGLTLGFAVQAEIFFLSLCLFTFFAIVFIIKKLKPVLFYFMGLTIGALPLVIAEIKFGLRGTKILFGQILAGAGDSINPLEKLTKYAGHLNLVTDNTIFGWGILGGVVFISLILISRRVIPKNEAKTFVIVSSIILGSHLSLFVFKIIDSVFLDLAVAIYLILLLGAVLALLFKRYRLVFAALLTVFTIFQLWQYASFVIGRKPFNHYGFIQEPSTLSHKEEIVKAIYEGTEGQEFTFASLGTPWGVRTVWASVFELYGRQKGVKIPAWYGYYANGYPGEEILIPAPKPQKIHVLVLEDNKKGLIPPPIIEEEMGNQNTHTEIVSEVTLYDTIIQFRQPK